LIEKGKLGCFIDKGHRKNSSRKSPKKKRSFEGGESQPRKMWSAADREQTDVESDSGAEKDGSKIFLEAIMNGFSAPNDTSMGTAKRKIVKVRETHGTPLKAARKRPLLSFTENKKVNEVSNEELLLVIVVTIREHNVVRCLVDEGSSVDIMDQDTFEKLGLKIRDLKPYTGTDLHGLNEMSTRSWGYFILSVTIGGEMDE
jgi:hypothetical protein